MLSFFLLSVLKSFAILFADDLTLIIKGGLEMKPSSNTEYMEKRAKTVLKSLETVADDLILPVNTAKTRAMLVHSAENAARPEMTHSEENIGYVSSFKCLGVEIGNKLAMDRNIDARLKSVRSFYATLRRICHSIPRNEISVRRNYCLYSLVLISHCSSAPGFTYLYNSVRKLNMYICRTFVLSTPDGDTKKTRRYSLSLVLVLRLFVFPLSLSLSLVHTEVYYFPTSRLLTHSGRIEMNIYKNEAEYASFVSLRSQSCELRFLEIETNHMYATVVSFRASKSSILDCVI